MKKLLLLYITGLLLASCGEPTKELPKDDTTTGTVETEQDTLPKYNHVELVKQYFYYFNNHEWDKMADMYADMTIFKDPSFGVGIVNQTKAQTSQKYASLTEYFPDIRDEIINIYPTTKDVVVVEFISTGTAKNGNTFELPICTIFTFKDGKIIKDFTYYDN